MQKSNETSNSSYTNLNYLHLSKKKTGHSGQEHSFICSEGEMTCFFHKERFGSLLENKSDLTTCNFSGKKNNYLKSSKLIQFQWNSVQNQSFLIYLLSYVINKFSIFELLRLLLILISLLFINYSHTFVYVNRIKYTHCDSFIDKILCITYMKT